MGTCCSNNLNPLSWRIPSNAADGFKWMELTEHLADTVDEGFHILGRSIQIYAGARAFEIGQTVHNYAHDFHNYLHGFCLLNDIYQLTSGRYVVYAKTPRKTLKEKATSIATNITSPKTKKEAHRVDLIQTVAKINQTVSHFYATMALFHAGSNLADRYMFVAKVFAVGGHSIALVDLVYKRALGQKDELFYSKLFIHAGGLASNGLGLAIDAGVFGPVPRIINIACSTAGIIRSVTIVNCLRPRTAAAA